MDDRLEMRQYLQRTHLQPGFIRPLILVNREQAKPPKPLVLLYEEILSVSIVARAPRAAAVLSALSVSSLVGIATVASPARSANESGSRFTRIPEAQAYRKAHPG